MRRRNLFTLLGGAATITAALSPFTVSGKMHNEWPLAGVPDATFFNPKSGLVHAAIADPGLIQSINPRTGASMQCTTAAGAKTTALVPPDHLFVFSSAGHGILDLAGA